MKALIILIVLFSTVQVFARLAPSSDMEAILSPLGKCPIELGYGCEK